MPRSPLSPISAAAPGSCRHRQQQRGMAIALIIVAVALVTLLGMVLTLAGRGGASTSEINHQAADAAIILEQAATLKTAIDGTLARNEDYISNLTLSATRSDRTQIGIYNPVDGLTEPQLPPGDAFTSGSGAWGFYPSDGRSAYSIYLNGVGTTNGADSVIALSGLTQGVCQQINQLLTGSTSIPVASVAVNFSNATTDLRAQTPLSGLYETCFEDSNNLYQYYKAIQAG